MKGKNEHVLDIYRMQLKTFFEKGFGEETGFSKGTIITPKLVKGILSRYFELGGDLDFLNVDIETYNEFIEEIKAC